MSNNGSQGKSQQKSTSEKQSSNASSTSTSKMPVAKDQVSKSKASRQVRSKKKSSKNREPFVLDVKSVATLKENSYEIKERLGVGAFAQVFKAHNGKRNVTCAVKIIDLSAINEKYHKKFLPREIKNLCNAHHEFIIRIYDIYRMSNRIFIFMELAKADLAHYIKKIKVPMGEKHACKWFYQVVSALNYLHNELKIAHRDIKIDNILITLDNSAKLADFGFSLKVEEGEENKPEFSKTFCGTKPYLSPQLNQKVPYVPYKADIWAMGVVLFAMLNNRYPFHYKDKKAMLKEQLDREYITGRFIESLSDSSKDLMEAMFEPEEEQRIETAQILQHEWITTYYDPNLEIKLDL